MAASVDLLDLCANCTDSLEYFLSAPINQSTSSPVSEREDLMKVLTNDINKDGRYVSNSSNYTKGGC